MGPWNRTLSGGKEERRDVGVDIQALVRVIDQGLFECQERTHIPLCSHPVKGYPGTLKMSWNVLPAACHLATSSHIFSLLPLLLISSLSVLGVGSGCWPFHGAANPFLWPSPWKLSPRALALLPHKPPAPGPRTAQSRESL